MDNVTHTLTGLALARAGLNRWCPRATALALVSANIPDSDIINLAKGPLAYLEAHRGYSHSLLCLPVMATLSVLIVAALYRERLPWARAVALCCIGVSSHLLLDWTNSYGIRLMLPFSPEWFHLDLNGLYDAAILTMLTAAAVWPWFNRLVSGEIGERASGGRGIALAALTFFALYDGGRALLHGQAQAQLQARIYDDAAPLRTAALPNSYNPFRWSGIVETAGSFQVLDVNALGQLDVSSARIYYKPSLTADFQAAKATEPFRFFQYFSRFPVWSENPVQGGDRRGARIELSDLRFGDPGHGSFHAIAFENERTQVENSWFTFNSGAELGWGDAISTR